jgi:hypothetical protein
MKLDQLFEGGKLSYMQPTKGLRAADVADNTRLRTPHEKARIKAQDARKKADRKPDTEEQRAKERATLERKAAELQATKLASRAFLARIKQ